MESSVATTSSETTSDLEEPLLLTGNGEEEPSEEEQSSEADVSTVSTRKYLHAALVLLFVSFLFATLNVSLRYLYTMSPPANPPQVNATRGWFTVLFFLPFLAARRQKEESSTIVATTTIRPLWMVAGELAMWNFLGQVFVNVGLLTTPSARAAFLGQTVIVLVPVLCLAMGGDALRKQDMLGCLSSAIGVVLLSTSSPSSSNDSVGLFAVHFGDLWILASAVCFSLYLVRVSHLACHYDEVFLQGTKNTLMALFYTLWYIGSLLVDKDSDPILPQWAKSSWMAWAVIAYTAFGPGCLADILQQKSQRIVGPTQSNLILCSSSVFTAILSRILLGEQTSWLEKWGGAFLVAGAIVAGSK